MRKGNLPGAYLNAKICEMLKKKNTHWAHKIKIWTLAFPSLLASRTKSRFSLPRFVIQDCLTRENFRPSGRRSRVWTRRPTRDWFGNSLASLAKISPWPMEIYGCPTSATWRHLHQASGHLQSHPGTSKTLSFVWSRPKAISPSLVHADFAYPADTWRVTIAH